MSQSLVHPVVVSGVVAVVGGVICVLLVISVGSVVISVGSVVISVEPIWVVVLFIEPGTVLVVVDGSVELKSDVVSVGPEGDIVVSCDVVKVGAVVSCGVVVVVLSVEVRSKQ